MENVCEKCQQQFKDEDQVVLDIFSKVTHEHALKIMKGLSLQLVHTKILLRNTLDLVDM